MLSLLLVLLMLIIPLNTEANQHPSCSEMQYVKKEASFFVWNGFKTNLQEERYWNADGAIVCARYFIADGKEKTIWQTWRKDASQNFIYFPAKEGSYKTLTVAGSVEVSSRSVFIDTNNLQKSELVVLLEFFNADSPEASGKIISGKIFLKILRF